MTLMSNDAGTTMEQVLMQILPLAVTIPQFIILVVLLAQARRPDTAPPQCLEGSTVRLCRRWGGP